MNEELSKLAHSVFRRGLDLRDRVQRGEAVDMELEQSLLLDLLLESGPSRPQSAFGAQPAQMNWSEGRAETADNLQKTVRYLGPRYALTCWLDELFTCDSPLSAAWNERKLEVELYGGSERAWRFWQQAELAQVRPGEDDLEVFYLAVLLGFRGQLRERPERLQTWFRKTKIRVGKIAPIEWAYTSKLEPAAHNAPLMGGVYLKRLAIAGWVAAIASAPFLSYFIARQLGQ